MFELGNGKERAGKVYGRAVFPLGLACLAAALLCGPSLWAKDGEGKKKEHPGAVEQKNDTPGKKTGDDASTPVDSGWETEACFLSIPPYRMLDPFSEMRLMHEHMESVFNNSFRRFRFDPGLGRPIHFGPRMDLIEEKDVYTIRMDVPGIDKDNLQVKVDGDVLIVSGKRKEARKETGEGGTRRIIHAERSYGEFRRGFSLPDGIDGKNVKATCKDGVLVITLPKKERTRDASFTVKVE